MPGLVLNAGATVLCSHGGSARPTQPDPRVRVGGSPAATAGAPYSVAGCPLAPPTGAPCVTGQWTVTALRVRLGGRPAVLSAGSSVCTPTGTPLVVVDPHSRVRGI